MNFFHYFLLLILLQDVCFVSSQKDDAKKKKPTKKKPANLKNRAYCLTCLTDFKSKSFDQFDTCLNPIANLTDAELRYFNMCPESARQCMVEIATVNGVFVGIERRCTSSCSSGCVRDGYGAENENCIYCCPAFAGSEYFDEETVKECPVYPSNASNFRQTNFSFLIVTLFVFCLNFPFLTIVHFPHQHFSTFISK